MDLVFHNLDSSAANSQDHLEEVDHTITEDVVVPREGTKGRYCSGLEHLDVVRVYGKHFMFVSFTNLFAVHTMLFFSIFVLW